MSTPQLETQSSSNFIDIRLTRENLNDIELTSQGKVILYVDDKKVIIKNTALTQFLHKLGFRKCDLKKYGLEPLRARLLEKLSSSPIVISAIQHPEAPKVLIAYRTTSPEYTPIPHRVLFDYVEGILKQAGIEVKKKKVVTFFKRTAMMFLLHQVPLKYARPDDAVNVYLVVSNANNAEDAIHVYTYVEILRCANGLIVKNYSRSLAIVHRGNVDSILARVGNAVKQVLSSIKNLVPTIKSRIEMLEKIKITEDLVRLWLNYILIKSKLPKKYYKWFVATLRKYINEFGYNTEALFQTLTYFVANLRKSTDVAQRLNREAQKLLENPNEYLKTVLVEVKKKKK